MTVKDLNRDQLVQLKQHYLSHQEEDIFPSWSELAYADEIISDSTIYEHYKDYTFTEDDFV